MEAEHEAFDSDAPFTELPLDTEDLGGELSFPRSHRFLRDERTRYLTFFVLLSLILHFAAIIAAPRISATSNAKSLLRPGETVQRVRLVELPPPKKEEPPPERASAISDRNHTAERERLPKAAPGPRGPIGRPAPMQQMAKLTPPLAPEDLIKPKEDTPEESPKPPEVKPKQPAPTKSRDPERRSPVTRREKPTEKTNVDLRPTPSEVARALSSPGTAKNSGGDFDPEGDVEEAVVDINTREDRFFSYLLHLKQKIEHRWVYPKAASMTGLGGELIVEFLVLNNGTLSDVSVLDSSGHGVLDDSAMAAIRTAAPYHPFPPSLRAKRLRIRARFIYVTQSFFRRIM